MERTCRIIMVGLGGYSKFYLSALREEGAVHDTTLEAVVDPQLADATRAEEFRRNGVAVFTDLADCLANANAELCILATPLSYHAAPTCAALEHGRHVLCEKPLAAVVQDGLTMQAAAAEAATHVGVGYQWSFSAAIRNLKEDILAGEFGRPLRLRTLRLPPRGYWYYRRNGWAGQLRDTNGAWVLDSPLSNATAHYLHNSLYVCGADMHTSATPATVSAELYRANDITNCDTAAVRVITDDGVEILHYCSHATVRDVDLMLHYEFERADVYCLTDGGDSAVVARRHDGRVRNYGNPATDARTKLWDMVACTRGGPPPVCGVDAALPHLLCVNAAQESVDEIGTFPPELIDEQPGDKGPHLAVRGLANALILSFAAGKLPAECGNDPWSVPGRAVDVSDYTHYPAPA